MADSQTALIVAALIAVVIIHHVLVTVVASPSPLHSIPGPKSYATTKWRLALDDYRGTRTRVIHALHRKHGTAVRIGPNEVSFSSITALRTIYGAGSGFERTDFYRMFDVYGRQNLFTLASAKDHGARKKILAHAYSKSSIHAPNGIAKALIESNARDYLRLIERETGSASEIFQSLHWFGLDSITGFLYGDEHGGTHALRGNTADRALLDDIVNPASRMYTWYAVHLKLYTKWLYAQTGILGNVISALDLLPMRRPTAYTALRAHALKSWTAFEAGVQSKATTSAADSGDSTSKSIMGKICKHSVSGSQPALDGLDMASELADHFDAGIDTTSDTLTFALWALSLPENQNYQHKLIAEVDTLTAADCNADGIPIVQAVDRLPFLDAVIKETLRLYAPLPASEPRCTPVDVVIDGFVIPAGTVVSMSPYTLHRNPDVFLHPLEFRPERWLGELGNVIEMKRWFWAFSSGGLMCIGLHLAMAEMTTLLSAVYRNYTTRQQEKQKGRSPAITSRFEIFYDEKFEETSVSRMLDACKKNCEHACHIDFRRRFTHRDGDQDSSVIQS